MEDLSLHDVVRGWFHVPKNDKDQTPRESWKALKDGSGWFRPKKPVVVKTPYVSCDKARSEELFHNLIQEFVPYRKESELKAGKSTWAEAFDHWVQSRPALWQGKAKRDTVEASKELNRQLLQEAAEEEAEEAQHQPAQLSLLDAGPAVCQTGFRAVPGYGTAEGLKSRVDSLNSKQLDVWKEVTEALAHQELHEDGTCKCTTPPQQVLKFISGGAGVGKSRLIESLTEAVETSGGQVVLAAPSGMAAQNIE